MADNYRGIKPSIPENGPGAHDSSGDLVMHSTSLHHGFEGGARGANHSALMDLSSVSSQRNDLHGIKTGTLRLQGTGGIQDAHNHNS